MSAEAAGKDLPEVVGAWSDCWPSGRAGWVAVDSVGAPRSLVGDHLFADHLQQLGDAELVHARPQIVGLGPQVFVHALGEPDGDHAGRLGLGIGRVPLLAEFDQHFLDAVEFVALLELGQFFEGRERLAHGPIDPEYLAKKSDPIGVLAIKIFGDLQNFPIVFLSLGSTISVSLRFQQGSYDRKAAPASLFAPSIS